MLLFALNGKTVNMKLSLQLEIALINVGTSFQVEI